jgi:hypothetical protein
MHAAVSSVNCGLKVKPSLPKNSIDWGRFLTGRLTKIIVVIAFLLIELNVIKSRIVSQTYCQFVE